MPAATLPPPIHLTPPLFAVRAVPGHEEDEALLKRTDLPAMGRAVRIWRDGTKLLADFNDVPGIVAKLIEQGAYSKVSAEFYEDFTAGGKLYGPVLRRVAMLGAEIPEVKTLADIPTPANGKLRGVEIFDTGVHKGTNYTSSFLDQVITNFGLLSRDADLSAKFAEATYKVIRFYSETKKMSAPLLAAIKAARKLPKKFSEKITRDACKATWKKFADDAASMAIDGPPAAVTRDDMLALLGQMGMDPAVMDQLDDEGLAEVVRLLKGQSDPAPTPEMPPTAPMSAAPAPAPLSAIPGVPDRTPSQVTLKFGEKDVKPEEVFGPLIDAAVAKALRSHDAKIQAAEGSISKFAEAQKKTQIDSELSLLVSQGKVTPGEVDGLKAQLYRADGIAKFSDGDTELDKQLKLIKARPNLVKMSEVIRVGKGGSADGEAQKVVSFSESPEIAQALKASGKSASQYVEAFRAAQKKKPDLTAAQYGVPAAYAA